MRIEAGGPPLSVAVCLAVGIVFGAVVPSAAAPSVRAARGEGGPLVRARAAVVMDAETGHLIYAKEPDRRLPPASTTKVMTAMLAIESGRLDDAVVVSHRATAVQPIKLYLRAGEQVRLGDLTYAMLLKSANDASVVVAEALGGSIRGFSTRMNRRAAELGARNTHFVNPNGLPATDHYSTARDLALIFRHALTVTHFREMAATRSTRVTAWRSRSRRRALALQNTNRLLTSYPVPVIGKTGFTRAAKRCFVGAARTPDGRDIVVALLGSTDLWGDARRLLDFGMAHATTTLTVAAHAAKPSAPEVLAPKSETAPPHVVALRRATEGAAAPGDTPPAPIATDAYSVVLVPSLNSLEGAERLRHYLDRRGHHAVVEVTGPPEGRSYRVRIPGLPDLDAALEKGAELRDEQLVPTIVPPG
jgi:D-alanyl-D-alanine carboxypeptidase (penicillin-binding protein 5/6)